MSEWPTSGVADTHRSLAVYLSAAVLDVTIISPTEAQVVLSSTFTVTWTFSPGTQASYRVRIFEDGTNVVAYDSGTVASSAGNHNVPEGVLESGLQYDLQVDISDTDGNVGVNSPRRNFSTSWAPSVPVENVTVVCLGDVCTSLPIELPRVRVRWQQVTPGAGETFVRYSIWRRDADNDGDWIRIASIDDVATTEYLDYNAASRTVWEYAVTWTATDPPNVLASNRQDPPENCRPEFDWAFIHANDQPESFVVFYSLDWSDERGQSKQFRRAWNRRAATAFIGEGEFNELSITGLPDAWEGPVWDDAKTVQSLEREIGTSLVLRIGISGDRFFVATNERGLSRRGANRQYQPDIRLTEVFVEEAVE